MTAQPEPLRRALTLWGLWLLVLNGLIGAGIFGVPGAVAALTRGYSPLLFVLCAILILPIILSHAELASYFRGTGGPIRYATDAFGSFAGFQSGWLFYLGRVASYAANLNLIIDSIAYFVPGANGGFLRYGLLALIAGGFTWVNVVGTSQAVRALGTITVAKFVPLLLIALGGIGYFNPFPAAGEVAPSSAELGEAALLVIYAYVGFEGALVPAGESKDPPRDMPRALFGGLAVATALYVLIQGVSLSVVPELAASESPLIDVGAALFGPLGTLVLTAGVAISVGGNLLAAHLSSPRITYALARDGLLPSVLGAVHPRYATPHVSVIAYGALGFGLAAFGSFVLLAKIGVLVRLLLYILDTVAIPSLRGRYGKEATAFVLPGGFLIPAASVVVSFWLLLQVKWVSWATTGVALVVGIVLYVVARSRGGPESSRLSP